jgi:CheY-like chemotaxis protein
VLVIDDCDVARTVMCELLREAWFAVFEEDTAIGATRVIMQKSIRAVILDVGMPGLTGDKLVELLRRTPRLQGLVIVLVSALEPEELERLALETRADAVLSKRHLEFELGPLLMRLLRGSAFHPASALPAKP